MEKSKLNKVWKELKKLSPDELIEAIVNYNDQKALNYDGNGKKKKYPTGMMAAKIREYGVEMSNKLFYSMSRDFARVIAG